MSPLEKAVEGVLLRNHRSVDFTIVAIIDELRQLCGDDGYIDPRTGEVVRCPVYDPRHL